MAYSIRSGEHTTLGATPFDDGVNFAVHAGPDVTKVELCLFDKQGVETRIALNKPEPGSTIWHGFVEGLKKEDATYGYRVDGPWDPQNGKRYNANKLLMDPYAKGLEGEIIWDNAVYGYNADLPKTDPDRDLVMDTRDSAPFVPKGRIVDMREVLQHAERGTTLHTPRDSVIVEAHVKGGTTEWQALDSDIRGTYTSYATTEFTGYMNGRSRNVLQFMTIHEHVDDKHLLEQGLTNFWGYMPISYQTPHREYAATDTPEIELAKTAVELRKKGIELWLDVVFNHTGEGDRFGPTLSFRGFDDNYYCHEKGNKRDYFDTTGCGNTLNFNHPQVRALAIDTLAHYVELGASGFRFDLGVALNREGEDFRYNPNSTFRQELEADPRLAGVKYTGEAWDVGRMDSYQVGSTFFAAWNNIFRDAVQEFAFSTHGGDPGRLAWAMTGSQPVFTSPYSYVNKVTSHDGSTPYDLVSFTYKNNYANLENNRDGPDEKYRQNAGVEGHTDDPAIIERRQQLQQFALALLALSQGMVMVPLGHERGHSQEGNSNAYPQDNPITHILWDLDLEEWQRHMLEFDAQVFTLRADHPCIRRENFVSGALLPGGEEKDITWIHHSGREMEPADWKHGQAFGFILAGGSEGAQPGAAHADACRDTKCNNVFVFINGGPDDITITLPELKPGERWTQAVNSAYTKGKLPPTNHEGGTTITLKSRSLVAFEGGVERTVSMFSGKSDEIAFSM